MDGEVSELIWTDEQREIQALAHDFAEKELRPATSGWDADRDLDDGIFDKLGEVGFLGMLIPEEYGGLDLDLGTYLLVIEELAWGDASTALAVAIHNGPVAGLVRGYGTPAQRERWLPILASGSHLGAFALSEPGAGSDPSLVRTVAEPVDAGWLLTGEKRWVTNGARAGLVVVFARTGDDTLGAFLVDPEAAGYSVGGREVTLGLRASQTVTVTLDRFEVPPDALLGDPQRGLSYALSALDVGRAGVAAQAVGIGRAAMEHAAKYSLVRKQFGEEIARFGAVQAKLAEMARQISGARLLAHAAADAITAAANGQGHARKGLDGATARAAMAKLAASEAASWAADEAIQIYGGYGYMKHYPVEQLLRDAKGTEIYEGTSEIMRHVVAREVLRDAAES